MGNITFLISAVLMVFLLQGAEQTRLVSTVAQSQVPAPENVLEEVKNGAFSLKTTDSIDKSQLNHLHPLPKALLTKS